MNTPNLREMYDKLNTREKELFWRHNNEYLRSQLAAQKRRKAIMAAKGKIEQEYEDDFNSEATRRI